MHKLEFILKLFFNYFVNFEFYCTQLNNFSVPGDKWFTVYKTNIGSSYVLEVICVEIIMLYVRLSILYERYDNQYQYVID